MELDRDRADEPTRRRRRTTTLELQILEQEFARCDKPSISERERISSIISRTDVDGPGMNSREIQVWFQNKRQAMRRAQGAYPLCSVTDEGTKIRKADEELFGIKLCSTRREHSTPSSSFTSVDEVQIGTTPTHGLATPAASTTKPSNERRARLVLSDTGDGHAELMFSPTPLKPSSPPRIPAMITPMRTPLSTKIASRSASSPALLSYRTPMTSKTTTFNHSLTSIDSNQRRTPLQDSNGGRFHNSSSLKSLSNNKRPREPMTPSTRDANVKRKRQTPYKTPSQTLLGRGKENMDPKSSFGTSQTPVRRGDDSYGRDIRRVHSEALLPSWQSSSTLPRIDRHSDQTAREGSSSPAQVQRTVPKKLSAEECAMSLVSLAHGS